MELTLDLVYFIQCGFVKNLFSSGCCVMQLRTGSTVMRKNKTPFTPAIYSSGPPCPTAGVQSIRLCLRWTGQGRNRTQGSALWWLSIHSHLQLVMSIVNVHPSVCVILNDSAHPRAAFATVHWPWLFITNFEYRTHACSHTHTEPPNVWGKPWQN